MENRLNFVPNRIEIADSLLKGATKVVERKVKLEFTDELMLQIGRALSDILVEKQAKENELKSKQAEIKSEIANFDRDALIALRFIREGSREVWIKCIVEKDKNQNIKNVIRPDTGEIIDRIPFDKEDYQEEFDLAHGRNEGQIFDTEIIEHEIVDQEDVEKLMDNLYPEKFNENIVDVEIIEKSEIDANDQKYDELFEKDLESEK
jgi:hypothetical protein